MPGWVIETFADAELTLLFWTATLLPVPLWVMMIFLPKSGLTKALANPFATPLLLCPAVGYLYYLLLTVGIPSQPTGWDFAQSKAFLTHPIVLMIFWTKLQIMHLFLGTVFYRVARMQGLVVPVTLLLAWFFGPLALPVFALRILLHCFNTGKSFQSILR